MFKLIYLQVVFLPDPFFWIRLWRTVNLGWHYLSNATCLMWQIEFATLFATLE